MRGLIPVWTTWALTVNNFYLFCLFNRLNRTTIENQSGIKLTGHCTDALFGMQG